MALFEHLKPSDYGAESAADVGFFVLGAAIGGLADATLNFAGFAEPIVVAGLAGAGALGLKKLAWDTPRQFLKARRSLSEREIAMQEIDLEIGLLAVKSSQADRERRAQFLEDVRRSVLDAEAIRRLWLTYR